MTETAPQLGEPPVASRRPTRLEAHGDVRVDEWYWLRDRDDPDVIAYLEAENAYTEAATAHTQELRDRLFEEIRSRIEETDETVPARKGDHWYYRRTVEGLSYRIHCRRARSETAPEQVLLDENELAAGNDYFALGAFAERGDARLLAYAVDVTGGERFTLRIRDLDNGRDLPDEIANVYYGTAWANDDRTVYYTRPNETMRPWQLWRHRVGDDPAGDVCLYTEEDERFHLFLSKTRSEQYVVVTLQSAVTTELRVLAADDPDGEVRIVVPRVPDVEHALDHRGGSFLLLTSDGAPNFRLVEIPVETPERERWRELVGERDGVRLENVDAFEGHVVLTERADAVSRIRVLDPERSDERVLEQPEAAYAAAPGENHEFATDTLRFEYSSLVTPPSVFDEPLAEGTRTLRKQETVHGYAPERFASERLWAEAADGERIPISIVYPRERPRDGSAPLLLYGYGSYESSIDPVFSSLRLSLLERGFAFAIAHVRGGGERGRRWYEDGKLERKTNTFTDFVACAEHLIDDGWTSPARLAIRGGSAGGLLMGAAVNMRPDLFGAVVAQVPFVDCVTTMLDDSLPLTVIEWEEWGDPKHDERFYRLLKSYSPYDNLEAKAYPPMLVTAGLNDPRVGFWEPAKWVAKLRALKTDENPLLLRTKLEAGHAGPSGRYDKWREEAFVYAFILDALGLA